MLTLHNVPTEFPKYDYVNMAKDLANVKPKYSRLTRYVKDASYAIHEILDLDVWEEFVENDPINAEEFQKYCDTFNIIHQEYNDMVNTNATLPTNKAKKATTKAKATKPRATASSNSKTNSAARRAKTASKQTPRKATKTSNSRTVARRIDKDIPPEITFMRRYIALDGKELNLSRANVLLASLQKAIIGKKIRKTSKYADEIRNIQDNLIKLVNNYEDGTLITIDKDTITDYTEKIQNNYPLDAIRLLKSYAFLIGKNEDDLPGIQTRAKKIYARLASLPRPGRYTREVEAAKLSLQDFINGSSSSVHSTDFALRGLLGLDSAAGLNGPVASTALANYQFQTVALAPSVRALIGEPDIPFKILVHGLPGSGKTTLALRIAHSLAEHNHMRVLFVSAEEGVSNKTQKRLDRLNLYSQNLDIAVALPSNLEPYDVVAIDSITALRMTPEELRELYRTNPWVSFILISQSTKSGAARGSLEFEHDVDTTIKCENMVAHVIKNRFGDCSTMRI